MELFPSPVKCSYQNRSAVAMFLVDLLLLLFGFFGWGRRYGTYQRGLSFWIHRESLIAYRFLFLSAATRTSASVERIAGLGAVNLFAGWVTILTYIKIDNYASRSPEPPGLGELVSPCSMSIAGLSETISGDTGFVSFLVNFCHKVFNSCCITGEIHTSFSIGESVIGILPSSLVMYRLVLCLLASEDSLGFRCWIL